MQSLDRTVRTPLFAEFKIHPLEGRAVFRENPWAAPPFNGPEDAEPLLEWVDRELELIRKAK